MADIEAILGQIEILGQIPSEIREFMAWLSERDIKSILEIGVGDGGTLACWKGLFPDAYVLGIDIGTGSDLLLSMQRKYGFGLMMRSDSHSLETFEKVAIRSIEATMTPSLTPEFNDMENVAVKVKVRSMFDFIFIDGDHSYEGVKRDYEMYWPLVRDEGVMAFHDIKDTEHHWSIGVFVGRFWNELKGSYSHSIKEFADPNEGWGGIGVIMK